MEQFIGCDAHKKFSVFVAVKEKGHAGEAMRVAHDRQLYREFLARLPAHSAIEGEANGIYGPPPHCKRKRDGQGWSAQMYTALGGGKRLRARMECATLCSHLATQSWKTSSEYGF